MPASTALLLFGSCSSAIRSACVLLPFSSILRAHDYIRPTWIMQDNLLKSEPLPSSQTKALLPCKVTWQVLEISMWTSLEAILLPTTICIHFSIIDWKNTTSICFSMKASSVLIRLLWVWQWASGLKTLMGWSFWFKYTGKESNEYLLIRSISLRPFFI